MQSAAVQDFVKTTIRILGRHPCACSISLTCALKPRRGAGSVKLVCHKYISSVGTTYIRHSCILFLQAILWDDMSSSFTPQRQRKGGEKTNAQRERADNASPIMVSLPKKSRTASLLVLIEGNFGLFFDHARRCFQFQTRQMIGWINKIFFTYHLPIVRRANVQLTKLANIQVFQMLSVILALCLSVCLSACRSV